MQALISFPHRIHGVYDTNGVHDVDDLIYWY